MFGRWVVTIAQVLATVPADVIRPPLVNSRQLTQKSLHAIGQRLIGRIHARKERVASDSRDLFNPKNAPHGRFDVAGHVRVPQLTGDRLDGFVRMYDQDFWMFSDLWCCRMDVKITKAIAELLVLLE